MGSDPHFFVEPEKGMGSLNIQERTQGRTWRRSIVSQNCNTDVCGRCGVLFDDQGENGWWIERGLWWHECDDDQPARIVVRKLARVA